LPRQKRRAKEQARCSGYFWTVTWLPPEPDRWSGTKVVRRAVAKIDNADRLGMELGPLTRKLGSLVVCGVAGTMSTSTSD